MIPRKVHGYLDYAVSAIVLLSPWLFGFADNDPARRVMLAVGGLGLLYSLMTDYELGAIKVIPFSMHLALDVMSGLFLLASPWLFGFADQVATPHVAFGLLEMGAALMTRRSNQSRLAHTAH
ncbi:MAG: SPW repeat domain-containing protein [Verrucomicrobiales bacterium]